MEQITYEQFLSYLRNYGTAVHCENYSNFYTRYNMSEENYKYYYDRGCAIFVNDWEYNGKHYISRYVHQTTPDADIDAVTAEWQNEASETAKKYENPYVWVISFTVSNGDLPPEKDKFYGWRNFVRKGEKYPADSRVRELNSDDIDIIKSACLPSLENDTAHGKQLANDFYNFDFENAKGMINIFGIFDGESLVGMATRSYEEPLGLAWLRDIFIVPDHRRMGFGKALALTVLSDYPDVKWHYQVAKDNVESVGLAKSLGFTLEGAELFVC